VSGVQHVHNNIVVLGTEEQLEQDVDLDGSSATDPARLMPDRE
jgi:hypothetical protein